MQDNAQTPIVFITGASGFLGRYVVAEALRRGYQVRAIAREKPPFWYEHPALEWVNLDLRTTFFEVFGNKAFIQI